MGADQAGMTIAVDCLPVTDLLAWASSSGEAVQNEDGQVRGSLLRHPNVTSGTLKAASEEILSEPADDYVSNFVADVDRAEAFYTQHLGFVLSTLRPAGLPRRVDLARAARCPPHRSRRPSSR